MPFCHFAYYRTFPDLYFSSKQNLQYITSVLSFFGPHVYSANDSAAGKIIRKRKMPRQIQSLFFIFSFRILVRRGIARKALASIAVAICSECLIAPASPFPAAGRDDFQFFRKRLRFS